MLKKTWIKNRLLKNIEETKKNYFIEEIIQNKLMSKKHQKTCAVLNYIKHSFILCLPVIGYVSISAFVSLVAIPIGITSSEVVRKIYAITVRIKKYKSIIKKKKKS